MTTEIYVVYVAVVVWLTRSRLILVAASAQEVILARADASGYVQGSIGYDTTAAVLDTAGGGQGRLGTAAGGGRLGPAAGGGCLRVF